MKLHHILSLFLAFFFNHPAKATTSQVCPDQRLSETAEDCPWANFTRTALERNISLSTILKDTLWPMIQSDSKKLFYKELWGTSLNFDEGEKQIIIQPQIVKELIQEFDVGPSWNDTSKIMHAGIQHTYGYMLSNLKTSFGYKRARWVQNELENGFGLPAGILGPTPKEGTLFTNVTYFLSNIAFRNEPLLLNTIRDEKGSSFIPAEFKNYNYKKLKIERLEETVKIENRTVVLRTDIVQFINPAFDSKKNSAMLVYSYSDSNEKTSKIISGFPVNASFAQRLFQEKNLGASQPIGTRYNAWIEGITNKNPVLRGSRYKVQQ